MSSRRYEIEGLERMRALPGVSTSWGSGDREPGLILDLRFQSLPYPVLDAASCWTHALLSRFTKASLCYPLLLPELPFVSIALSSLSLQVLVSYKLLEDENLFSCFPRNMPRAHSTVPARSLGCVCAKSTAPPPPGKLIEELTLGGRPIR